MRKKFKFYLLPILSGFLVGTSFIPMPPWALTFFLVPLFIFVARQAQNPKQVFCGAWWTQFLFSMIGFFWIASTAHDFGYLSWPISIGILLLFAAFMHIYIPIVFVIVFKLSRKHNLTSGAMFVLFGTFLVLGEMFWPSIFSWNMGYPLMWIHSPFAQYADVIGFQGLGLVIYLINAWVAWVWLRKDRTLIRNSIMIAGVSLSLLWWGGKLKSEHWKKTDTQLDVLVVQANIGNKEKRSSERKHDLKKSVVEDFFDLTIEGLQANPTTNLVIWPESAFPFFLDDQEKNRMYPSEFRDFVKNIKTPVLTGAFSRDPYGTGTKVYNALFLFDQEGNLMTEPYRKTKLLAFGETVPFADTFPILAKYNPTGPGFGRGNGPTTMDLFGVKIGPQICYESLYPEFSAKSSLLGAQILVNLTNDSWFGKYSEPYQHLYMTLARAVETRRPLIRSTNTGISAVVLADGSVLPLGPIDEKWFGFYSVPYLKNSPTTFYAKFGTWLWVCVFVLIGLTITFGKKRST